MRVLPAQLDNNISKRVEELIKKLEGLDPKIDVYVFGSNEDPDDPVLLTEEMISFPDERFPDDQTVILGW